MFSYGNNSKIILQQAVPFGLMAVINNLLWQYQIIWKLIVVKERPLLGR